MGKLLDGPPHFFSFRGAHNKSVRVVKSSKLTLLDGENDLGQSVKSCSKAYIYIFSLFWR